MIVASTGPNSSTLPVCAPPDVRVPPHFEVFFRRHLPGANLSMDGVVDGFTLACVLAPSSSTAVSIGWDLHFLQTWSLEKLAVGDLSSTIALAPREELTLEFQSSQRRVLEQDTVDSAESQDQMESTTIDKEVMSTVRSASHNHSWHVDGSGSFSLGGAGASVSGGVSDSLTQTSQQSMEHMTEATQKSSQTLKTLHKVEVRGVTEGAVTNRMTRVIRNLFKDRTLTLNVFQLVKQFSVTTSVEEVRPVLVIQVRDLVFDEHFVVTNAAFLRQELLDGDLITNLSDAVEAASPVSYAASATAYDLAQTALRFLFHEIGLFNVMTITRQGGGQFPEDPNDPANSFDVDSIDNHTQDNQTALGDALRNNMAPLYTTLGFFYRVYQEMVADDRIQTNAVAMATALADAIGPDWQAVTTSADMHDQVKNILDFNDFTEIFRRISGFNAIVNGMLRPLVGPADEEQKVAAEHTRGRLVLSQVIDHLTCNKNYYIQRFLEYIATNTANQAIVDFVNAIIASPAIDPAERDAILAEMDIQRAFIDRQDIVVPAVFPMQPGGEIRLLGRAALDGNPSWTPPPPVTTDIEVPADGIHLEVAAGLCVLSNVPDPNPEVHVSVGDAKLDWLSP
jgi:hypothetical protein